jgi:hypothetical protein
MCETAGMAQLHRKQRSRSSASGRTKLGDSRERGDTVHRRSAGSARVRKQTIDRQSKTPGDTDDARYETAEFRQSLIEHMHAAKRSAIAEQG